MRLEIQNDTASKGSLHIDELAKLQNASNYVFFESGHQVFPRYRFYIAGDDPLKALDYRHHLDKHFSGHPEKSWFLNFKNQLDKMRGLEDNWNGLGSAAPNATAFRNLDDLMLIFHEMNFIPSQISPSAEEGIGISFLKDEKYAIIECYNDGNILIAFTKGSNDPIVWEVRTTDSSMKSAILRVSSYINAE